MIDLQWPVFGGAKHAKPLHSYRFGRSILRLTPALLCVLTSVASAESSSAIVPPFELERGTLPVTPLDAPVMSLLREKDILPAKPCSDAVFFRRAYLDIIGTLPDPRDLRLFLDDPRPTKRAELIDQLLERDEFADYWALKWGDLLRIKAEFPINLWPNAVQAYARWIHEALRHNTPYDQFARALLTSSGSNFRVAPVNFYRAIQGRAPEDIASTVALTFMGVRFQNLTEEQRAGMAALFSRLAYKKTAEWKEEIVFLNPALADTLNAVLPDGSTVFIPADKDPREVFADWLITPQNPWFARNIVNRVWSWFMGRGIIHEPDDIRPDNPPSNPELLALLEKEFIDSGYDLKHLYRIILNSLTYQQSSIPRSDSPEAEALFAFYPVRRLEAEVLIDALNWIGGVQGETYTSPIPEPFTFIPDDQRSITLADGSITSAFLEMFGRPPRDSGYESERNNQPTDAQRLSLLNSSQIQGRIERSPRLRRVVTMAEGDPRNLTHYMYLTLLSRYPTGDELAAAETYFETPGLDFKDGAADLAWSLINSKEFLYRH